MINVIYLRDWNKWCVTGIDALELTNKEIKEVIELYKANVREYFSQSQMKKYSIVRLYY